MGALEQTTRHATISNNLANTGTHGFKPDWSLFEEVPVEDEFHPERRFLWDQVLMNTGGGVWNDKTVTNLTPGPMQYTGNPFDVALQDEPGSNQHSFFMIRPDGGDQTFYSRDGHFIPDQAGVLRTVTGDAVLGPDGAPIVLAVPDDAKLDIRDDGMILAYTAADGNIELGQIGVMRTADFRNMKKVGDSRFISEDAAMEPYQAGIRGGYLEESATSAIEEMTNMIEASRIYETNMRFLTIQDETLGQTVRRVGASSQS